MFAGDQVIPGFAQTVFVRSVPGGGTSAQGYAVRQALLFFAEKCFIGSRPDSRQSTHPPKERRELLTLSQLIGVTKPTIHCATSGCQKEESGLNDCTRQDHGIFGRETGQE